MKIFDPPLPFSRPLLPPLSKVMEQLRPLWEEGRVTKGPLTEAYEKAVCQYLQVSHAVAVSSCTTGLILTLKALKLEGEFLVPSFTFSATVQALLWNHLKPVFLDCHPKRLTSLVQELEKKFTKHTAGVLVPYIFGNPPPLEFIQSFCDQHALALIFDAAHGFGTLYQGKVVGSHGKAHVFSSSATKLLCTAEGGIITTHDGELAENLRVLREYGNSREHETVRQGLNGRMTEFQAALGILSLERLEDHAIQRNKLAAVYKEVLKDLAVSFQELEPSSRSSYKDFAIILNEDWILSRDQVAEILNQHGIPTRNYFYPPLHQQKFFADHASIGNLPNTEKISSRILCLPMFYDLKVKEIKQIGEVFQEIFQNQGKFLEGLEGKVPS